MWWQVDGAYSFQACPASEFVFTQLLYVIEDWCWSRSFFCVCTLCFFYCYACIRLAFDTVQGHGCLGV